MHVPSHWFRPLALLVCLWPVQTGAQESAPPPARPPTQGTRPAPDSDLAERLYQSGDRAYGTKAYKAALETWQQLLQVAPGSPYAARALLRMARHALEVDQQPEAAMPFLDQLRTDYLKFPEAPEALLLRGKLLAQQARRPAELKDATAEFHRVLDLFPDAPACAEARLQLGLALAGQDLWGRALVQFVDVIRLHTGSPVVPRALLQAGEILDRMGDLDGSLRMLQRLHAEAPGSPEAREAAWRMAVRVKHRLQKPPLRNEGPWPVGRVKWLKTPLLLASAPNGDLLIFQNDLDRTFRLHDGVLMPQGPQATGVRALIGGPGGTVWMLTKSGLVREEAPAVRSLGALSAISGASLDAWGNLWVADAKTPALTLFDPAGEARTLASPTANALATAAPGLLVLAADADRKLLFLGSDGQPREVVPYGKDLPAPFRNVVALAGDGAGQVAALVDGGEYGEGVVIFGPDGAVLRHATFKELGVSGRITSLVLDRSGSVILCDRRNDVLIRLN